MNLSNKIKGRIYFSFGFILFVLAGTGFGIFRRERFSVDGGLFSHISFPGSGLIVPFFLIALMMLGWKMVTKGRQIRASIYNLDQVVIHSKKQPILFIRPFTSDELPSYKMNYLNGSARAKTPIEFHILRATQKLGPLIAIGNPQEQLPTLGAARAYYDGDSWEAKFYDHAEKSQLIIASVGLTEHIIWEVGELLKRKLEYKLIIHVPFKHTKELSEADQWMLFVLKLQKLNLELPYSFPMDLGKSKFLYFKDGTTPTFFPEQHEFSNNENEVYYNLRCLLNDLGRLKFNRDFETIIVVVVLVAVAVALVLLFHLV